MLINQRVNHKLFWDWTVTKIKWKIAVVKFDDKKFWIRNVEMAFLTKISKGK